MILFGLRNITLLKKPNKFYVPCFSQGLGSSTQVCIDTANSSPKTPYYFRLQKSFAR